jgi:hypothetical protein
MVFWGSGYEHLNSPTVHQSVGDDMFYAFEPCFHALRGHTAGNERETRRLLAIPRVRLGIGRGSSGVSDLEEVA